MKEQNQMKSEVGRAFSPTGRDLLAIGFRQRRLIVLSFLGVFLAVALYALGRTEIYQAQMKILVERERVDPLVTSEEKPLQVIGPGVTEQDLDSEVELLKSRDLLEKLVISSGLYEPKNNSWWSSMRMGIAALIGWAPDKDMLIAQAVFVLEDQLQVEPLRNTRMIKVTYASSDRQLSARVLKTLADLYLEKHLAVHRPSGTLDFFQQEAERYRKGLSVVEGRLADFGRDQGVVSLPLEKEIALRKLTELEAALQGAQAEIVATKERIRALEAQAGSTPSRMTTQVRTSSRPLEQLRSTLLTLELKHIELLGTFKPSYPPVREVEKQIAETRAAIAASEKMPLVEETTDRDPTYEWARSELAKAKSELATLQARATASAQTLQTYREKTRRLDRVEFVQQDLMRDAKLAEQNYMVYFRKQEEARISGALDRQRIMNVAIAEAATVPFLPSGPPRLLILILGGILATLVSVGSALALDYWDPSFRTPQEVEAFLEIPVAAAMPKKAG